MELPDILFNPVFRSILGACLVGFIFLAAMVAVWFERKFASDIQQRLGPSRTGPHGLLQLFADAIKLLTKEDVIPRNVDRLLFALAPAMMLLSVFLLLVALPFGALIINDTAYPIAATEMDISILYVEAVSAISVIGVFMAAYSSNNKYSLLSAFRNFARMIGYEVPLGLTVVGVAIMAGSLNVVEIAQAQSPLWFVFKQPLGFVVFFIAMMADMGRHPFDQNESEEELIAGWITEYTGMRFGLGFFAEYIHLILGAMIIVLLFLGGWNLPVFLTSVSALGLILPTVFFMLKVCLVMLFIIMVRWSIPRLAIDKVVEISWKKLLPLALINLGWVIALALLGV